MTEYDKAFNRLRDYLQRNNVSSFKEEFLDLELIKNEEFFELWLTANRFNMYGVSFFLIEVLRDKGESFIDGSYLKIIRDINSEIFFDLRGKYIPLFKRYFSTLIVDKKVFIRNVDQYVNSLLYLRDYDLHVINYNFLKYLMHFDITERVFNKAIYRMEILKSVIDRGE